MIVIIPDARLANVTVRAIYTTPERAVAMNPEGYEVRLTLGGDVIELTFPTVDAARDFAALVSMKMPAGRPPF
jgi:hypothetical protein